MSVTDPFIKDIKGCVVQFIKSLEANERITDNSFYLVVFCSTLEKIFDHGLIRQQNTLYFNRQIDPYSWMASITKEKSDIVTFAYVNCVDNVKIRRDLHTNYGRFRLLIKYCLAKKCLHVPVEFLMRTDKSSIFYKENSIIGDEILSEILLSVLLQVTKFNFEFDLNNSSFLDTSWYVPDLALLELVPCKSLGLSVSFAGERAVIVSVDSNSVAAENGKIRFGDVLEKLNGRHVTSATKGRLCSILRSAKGPITLSVAKAYNPERKEFFAPIKVLLKQLKIDLDLVAKQYDENLDISSEECSKSGFEVMYLGCVDVGEYGNVKQVNRAMRKLLSVNLKNTEDDSSDIKNELKVLVKVRLPVVFEIGEIGVKIKNFETEGVILDHSYMKISSCGGIPTLLNNFGYIAGDENCDVANNFACYIFEVNKPNIAETILQSIGQGFRRTHYAV